MKTGGTISSWGVPLTGGGLGCENTPTSSTCVYSHAIKIARPGANSLTRVGEVSGRGHFGDAMDELLIDEQDRDLLKWTWRKEKNWGYYRRRSNNNTYYLHVVVLERMLGRSLSSDEMGDHKNRNKNDNRRENIRPVSSFQNAQNRSVQKISTTGLRGVCFCRRDNSYSARVRFHGKRYYLGSFKDPNLAASAAQTKRQELGFLDEVEH